MPTYSLLLVPLVLGGLAAQGTPFLVADLGLGTPAAYEWGALIGGVRAGTFSVFLEDDGMSTHVWRSDGTNAGTNLLATIPGSRGSSYEAEVVTRNGLVFFSAPGITSDHLWVTDGTVAGTLEIANGGRDPASLTVDLTTTSTQIWFSATDSFNGRELWRSNGTAAGTTRMTQIRAGSGNAMGSDTKQIACATSGVYFAANNGTTGMEVWRVAGIAVSQFADVFPGGSQALPREFTAIGDHVMFSASGPNGREPYCIAAGVLQAINVAPGTSSSSPEGFVAYRASSLSTPHFWFAADNGTIGRELWRYNAATGALSSIDLQFAGDSNPRELHVVGSRVVGIATVSLLDQLFTVPATSSPASILLPSASHIAPAFSGQLLVETPPGGLLTGVPHRTDGLTAAPLNHQGLAANVPLPPGDRCLLRKYPAGSVMTTTASLTPLLPQNATPGSDPRSLVAMPDGTLLFVAADRAYRTDGTLAGTQSLVPFATVSGTVSPLFAGRRFFVATQGNTQLRSTDGTVAGTTSLGVVVAGATCTWAIHGQKLLLFLGSTLYATDGTSAPQVLATGVASFPMPQGVGNVVVFRGSTVGSGVELWATDGTVAGTGQIAEIQAGSGSGVPDFGNRFCAVASGHVLFAGFDGSTYGLWRTDGTSIGTAFVSTVSLDVTMLGSAIGRAWFKSGFSAWSSDGTTPGTANLGVSALSLELHGEMLGKAILTASTIGPSGAYASSGTAATTTLLDSTLLSRAVPMTNYLTTPAEQLFVGGYEPLARTDGTALGTYSIGPTGGTDFFSAPGADIAFFRGHVGLQDDEPWRTNGTAFGTYAIADLHPGTRSSSPSDFTAAGGLIYFAATDGLHGRELWAMTAPASASLYGSGCPGTLARTPGIHVAALPRLGSTFTVAFDQALANTFAIQVLGLGATNLPLGGGCTLLANPDSTLTTLTGPTGTGQIHTAIPNSLPLVGLSLFAQFAVLDPAGAYSGLVAFSGGLQGIVGL